MGCAPMRTKTEAPELVCLWGLLELGAKKKPTLRLYADYVRRKEYEGTMP
jgi:hypothetical protein